MIFKKLEKSEKISKKFISLNTSITKNPKKLENMPPKFPRFEIIGRPGRDYRTVLIVRIRGASGLI